jgi:hypothetical protein
MDYEEIHEWLDHLDEAMVELAAATQKFVDVGHFADVGWIVYELERSSARIASSTSSGAHIQELWRDGFAKGCENAR